MVFVPERWDVGLWDEAHWDGQLGLDAVKTTVTIAASPVNFRVGRRIVAATTPVVVSTFAAGLRGARGLAANKATILVTGYPAALAKTGSYALAVDKGSIDVTSAPSALRIARMLRTQSGPIVVAGQPAALTWKRAYRLAAAPGAVVVTGRDADLIYVAFEADYTLTAWTGHITVAGGSVEFERTRIPPPASFVFGHQRFIIPGRW